MLGINTAQAELSGFGSSLIPKNKKPVKIKIYKAKIKQESPREIKDAIVLELPSNKFIGRNLSPNEKLVFDQKAKEIILGGLMQTDPLYSQSYDLLNRSKSFINRFGAILKSRLTYQNYSNQGSNYQAKNYILEKEKHTEQLLQAYKSLFEPKPRFNSGKAKEIQNQLSLLCGESAVMQIKSLLERQGEKIALNH